MTEFPNFNLELSCNLATMTIEPPLIQLPFPPTITANDIVQRRHHSRIRSKSPNAFFVYRKAFYDQLALSKQRYQMTYVSKLVSHYWKNETELVKTEYKRIADEVEVKLNEERIKDLVYSDTLSKPKRPPKKQKRIRKKYDCDNNKGEGSNTNNFNEQQNNSKLMESQIHIDQPTFNFYNVEFCYNDQLAIFLQQ
ncbi:MATA-HMG [Gigaspora margarita]|uniref:MATA-HMG n=2 Tax=Gigaspora margarita TaxID=4874 RepID=A0A8H3WZJ2_GIGMA|nr:MATA-HMG [Gigaspora margarita]